METTTKSLFWKDFYNEADAYYNAVLKSNETQKFNAELQYNIITMAVEKYLVAALFFKDFAPTNHTLSGLAEEIKYQKHNLPEELIKEIFFIDTFQFICSLDGFTIKNPSNEQVERMIKTLCDLKAWTDSFVKE